MKKNISIVLVFIILLFSVFFIFKKDNVLKMQLIPSQNLGEMQKSAKSLNKVMNKELKKIKNSPYTSVEVSVGRDYNSAMNLLKTNAIQLSTISGGENNKSYDKIVTATRPAMNFDPVDSKTLKVKSNDEKVLLNAYNKNRNYNLNLNSKSRSYRSLIVTKKGSKLNKKINNALSTQGSNWKLKWSKVKPEFKTAYKGHLSASSYIYYEIWLKKHFIGFESLVKSLPNNQQYKVSNSISEQSKKLHTNQINIFATYSGAFSEKARKLDFYNMSKEFQIIGISNPISNDGIATNNNKTLKEKKVLSQLLYNTIQTKEGKIGFKPYLYENFYKEHK